MTKSVRWPPSELARLEASLDELAESVREKPENRSDQEQAWLVKFLIVRSCGYMEQVMHICATGHLREKSYGTAKSYSLSWLSRSINPSAENILSTLGRFDAEFADEFREMLDKDNGSLANDLGALITKRHAIAHGENEGLGARRALDLYETAKQVADWMILRLHPDPSWGSSFPRS
jgi:hypothetical protein